MMKAFLQRAVLVLISLPALLLVMSPPARAAAQGRQVEIFSFEDASCAAWMKSSGNKGVRAQYEFWIRGFVSGHNYGNQALQVRIGAFPSGEVLYRYLDQYCLDSSTSSFVGGAIKLVEELREPVAASRAAPAKRAPAKSEPAKTPPAAK